MKALVDTSFLYALADRDDRGHQAAVALLTEDVERIVPLPVIPEAAYMIGKRLGYPAMQQFVHRIAAPSIRLEAITHEDLRRIGAIIDQYADARFDFVDMAIMALSERLNIQTVLTFDRRDFQIFRPRHCDRLDIKP